MEPRIEPHSGRVEPVEPVKSRKGYELTFSRFHWFYWFYTPAVWFYTWFYCGSIGSTRLPSKSHASEFKLKETRCPQYVKERRHEALSLGKSAFLTGLKHPWVDTLKARTRLKYVALSARRRGTSRSQAAVRVDLPGQRRPH